MINIFSAHPDDCEISIGGILLSTKIPFRIIYATKGELLFGKRDPREFFDHNKEIHYLEEGDCRVENNLTLRRKIEKFTDPFSLNIVHWPEDSHKDHREFSSAVYDVCRGKNIIYYQSVSAKKFLPNIRVRLSMDVLETKIERLKKAFDLDRYYLKEEFLRKTLENGDYYEYLYIEDSDSKSLKLLLDGLER